MPVGIGPKSEYGPPPPAEAAESAEAKLWQEAREIRRIGKFEVHITSSATDDASKAEAIKKELQQAGLKKLKFFTSVSRTTAHEPVQPGGMFTTYVDSMAEAEELVKKGMGVLQKHGLAETFEIELVLGPAVKDYSDLSGLKDRLDGYKEVEKAPQYENHLIWSGPRGQLPTFEKIEEMLQQFGAASSQIVDLSETAGQREDPNVRVSRVATIFQPGRDATMKFANRLLQEQAQKKMGYEYSLAEQVVLVGESR